MLLVGPRVVFTATEGEWVLFMYIAISQLHQYLGICERHKMGATVSSDIYTWHDSCILRTKNQGILHSAAPILIQFFFPICALQVLQLYGSSILNLLELPFKMCKNVLELFFQEILCSILTTEARPISKTTFFFFFWRKIMSFWRKARWPRIKHVPLQPQTAITVMMVIVITRSCGWLGENHFSFSYYFIKAQFIVVLISRLKTVIGSCSPMHCRQTFEITSIFGGG